MVAHLNRETYDGLKELLEDGFVATVQQYLSNGAVYCDDISKGIDTRNVEQIEAAAHSIKSSSAMLGFDEISEYAKKIEDLSGQEPPMNDEDYEQIVEYKDKLLLLWAEAEAFLTADINK